MDITNTINELGVILCNEEELKELSLLEKEEQCEGVQVYE